MSEQTAHLNCQFVMTSLLRQIVAGPRLQHPEAGLDLCYVTDNLIATSGPSSTYPQRAYRNPTDALVRFLDSKHGENWYIWEFRAEGTGYPDSEVYGRIHHFPWPDHHPPPFALIPAIMASMRNWLEGAGAEDKQQHGKRVAVVHCKAGKGRSGTVACSYLISQEGWKMEDALQRFTERRMKVGFGNGVSIPSQIRWVGYVDRWANQMDKVYVERPVEILEIHVWGLRDRVNIAVEGYVDEGKKIKCFHLFRRSERIVVDTGKKVSPESTDSHLRRGNMHKKTSTSSSISSSSISVPTRPTETVTAPASCQLDQQISAVILRPSQPLILPTSDVNIDFERRTKAAYTGWAMVTSIAHVWFNAYFEGGDKYDSGVFECEWESLDGIKGSTRNGTKALERVKVVWRYPPSTQVGEPEQKREGEEAAGPIPGKVITLPKPGEPVPESQAADWRGENVTRDEDCQLLRDQGNNPLYPSVQKKHKSPFRILRKKTGNEKGLMGECHPPVIEATNAAADIMPAKSSISLGKGLGLRKQTPASRDISRDISLATSVEDLGRQEGEEEEQDLEQKCEGERGENEEEDVDMVGVKPCFKDENGNGNGNDRDHGNDITKDTKTET
ncbi:hypothetical protein VTN77DRAFT_4828 [Rasamsonia byssochlamydoides]|uniref:uncharacterized protein n=1 Tax=Rasamsonia byssochlamydoides TaxID=89139 RepID=UPI003742070E